jgi:hypothetical protein
MCGVCQLRQCANSRYWHGPEWGCGPGGVTSDTSSIAHARHDTEQHLLNVEQQPRRHQKCPAFSTPCNRGTPLVMQPSTYLRLHHLL